MKTKLLFFLGYNHTVWYVIFLLFMFCGCKTYNVYIVEPSLRRTSICTPTLKENRFTSLFKAADSSFINMSKLREASKYTVKITNEEIHY